jgi:hypothetical protein
VEVKKHEVECILEGNLDLHFDFDFSGGSIGSAVRFDLKRPSGSNAGYAWSASFDRWRRRQQS